MLLAPNAVADEIEKLFVGVMFKWCNDAQPAERGALIVGPGPPPNRHGHELLDSVDVNLSLATTYGDGRRAAQAVRRVALGDFLRTRRAAVTPQDVGLSVSGRRKTPGLRREEVALLAGVGLSWYTWLEQARDITASAQVLESIGRALLLDQIQTDHLFRLAGFDIPDSSTSVDSSAELSFDEIVGALMPHAAYVLDPRFDVVAFNGNAELILGGLAQPGRGERNLLRWFFGAPDPHGLDESTAPVAHANLLDFRVEYARHAGDPWYEQLIAELSEESTQFKTWWDEHDVEVIAPTHRRIPHLQHDGLQILFIETRPVHQPEHRLRIIVPADERTTAIFAENGSARG